MTTTITTIPLTRLVPSKANVRRTGATVGIEELAASIEAHGLRQNLNVLPVAGTDRFEVVAGGRRLKALKLLAKRKTIAKDEGIPCRILDEGEDAGEISLAENAVRLDMHPLDAFEAFDRLACEQHMPIEDIAARFGVTPALVERRLKLARVSPKLRNLYRKGALTLEILMAFTISDDHAAQEEAWNTLPDWSRTPAGIRTALTGGTVKASHKLARFVGVETYVAAGGGILRDLFEPEHEGYLTDHSLLVRLAEEKLAAAAAAVEAEGWGWVKPEVEADHAASYGWIEPLPNDDEDDDTERFAPEDMARAGAILRIDYDGNISVMRGRVRAEDLQEPESAGDTPSSAGAKARETGALSAALVADLTAHRTAALRLEMACNPTVALAATVHALALALLYPAFRGAETCLVVRASSESLERHVRIAADCRAHELLAKEGEVWRLVLPERAADLFAWCLAAGQDTLLRLLAYLAGLSVNAVNDKAAGFSKNRLDHAEALGAALNLDMAQYWTPSVDGFFGRLTKATLIEAVTEARAPLAVNLGSLKKDEAARCVAKVITGTGWLPAPLRIEAPSPAPAEAA